VLQRITPFFWFHDQAEEAAVFYTSIFSDSKIVTVTRYGQAGHEVHGRPPGSVMTVEFELEGQRFAALNGGPLFTFNQAISFVVNCRSQEEVDYYWDKLSGEGGKPGQCGWLQDKFGVPWQVVPRALIDMITSGETDKAQRAFQAMLQMKKLDIAAAKRAFDGSV
jgi:predicted 3-demethylubiquinone-9 3-methyltransferase (glyoxalase superfamily)